MSTFSYQTKSYKKLTVWKKMKMVLDTFSTQFLSILGINILWYNYSCVSYIYRLPFLVFAYKNPSNSNYQSAKISTKMSKNRFHLTRKLHSQIRYGIFQIELKSCKRKSQKFQLYQRINQTNDNGNGKIINKTFANLKGKGRRIFHRNLFLFIWVLVVRIFLLFVVVC